MPPTWPAMQIPWVQHQGGHLVKGIEVGVSTALAPLTLSLSQKMALTRPSLNLFLFCYSNRLS